MASDFVAVTRHLLHSLSRARSLAYGRLVVLFAIVFSDRNEKLLLVLITVYSYLTLPFDSSSGYPLYVRIWILAARMHHLSSHTHTLT